MPSKLNWREEAARECAEQQGFQVYDRGWPDFLLYKPETGECIFLEVKSEFDELSPIQKKIHWILHRLNLDVKTVVIGNKKWRNRLAKAVTPQRGKGRLQAKKADYKTNLDRPEPKNTKKICQAAKSNKAFGKREKERQERFSEYNEQKALKSE